MFLLPTELLTYIYEFLCIDEIETRLNTTIYASLRPMRHKRYTMALKTYHSGSIGDDSNHFHFSVVPFKQKLYTYDATRATCIDILSHTHKLIDYCLNAEAVYFVATTTEVYRVETHTDTTLLRSALSRKFVHLFCSNKAKIIGYKDRLYYVDTRHIYTWRNLASFEVVTTNGGVINIDRVNSYMCLTTEASFSVYKRYFLIKTYFVSMFAEQGMRIAEFRRVTMVHANKFYVEDDNRRFYVLDHDVITPIVNCIKVLRFRNFIVLFEGNGELNRLRFVNASFEFTVDITPPHICVTDTISTDHHTICWMSEAGTIYYIDFPVFRTL